jgi:hypothetical protein
MIEYKIRIQVVHDNCKKHNLGFYIPELIYENSFTNSDNPLYAREKAFDKVETYLNIFETSKTETGEVENIFINISEDVNINGIIPEIELWMDFTDDDLIYLLDADNKDDKELIKNFSNPLYDILIDIQIGKYKKHMPEVNRLLFSNKILDPHGIIENLHREYIYYKNKRIDVNTDKIIDIFGKAQTMIKSKNNYKYYYR